MCISVPSMWRAAVGSLHQKLWICASTVTTCVTLGEIAMCGCWEDVGLCQSMCNLHCKASVLTVGLISCTCSLVSPAEPRSFMSNKRLGTFDACVWCVCRYLWCMCLMCVCVRVGSLVFPIPSRPMCLSRLCVDSGCMVTTSFSLLMLHAKALDEGPMKPWSANGNVP